MKSFVKNITALLLLVALLISSCITVVSAGQPSSYSKTYNSGERDVVCTTLNGTSAGSYYTGDYTYDNLSSLSSSALLASLRTLMTSTHDEITSYADCKNYSDNTDCQNGDGTVVLLYTSYVATMGDWISGSTGWNREHVWPQSLGGFGTSNAGADLHHIRPDDNKTNSTRGNKKFGEVDGGSQAYGSSTVNGMSGGTYNSTYFEPLDNVKGDVARICLYVYARWGGSYSKCSSITNVFQSVDVLLEWCALDPVDTWEMGRNEVVEQIQGNRNVFIDYPELAWVLFDREIPSDMVTPSGEAAKGSGTGSGNGGTAHTHSYTSAVTKQPTCTVTGVRTYTCACGDSYTQSIAALGHSYTSTVTKQPTCTETGVKIFACTCGDGYTQPISKVSHSYKDGYCTACGASDGSEPVCEHSSTQLKDAVAPSCQSGGYTGDLYCLDCDELIGVGTSIPSLMGHDFGEWQTDAEGRVYKVCDNCGNIQDISVEVLLAEADDEAELIIVLISLGLADKMLIDELS